MRLGKAHSRRLCRRPAVGGGQCGDPRPFRPLPVEIGVADNMAQVFKKYPAKGKTGYDAAAVVYNRTKPLMRFINRAVRR